ncbi:hypothetical protein Tco_0596631 [Tanacetum coccineum]
MSDLKFADTHNLVAFLEKPTESEGFEEIVDFLNANPIKYALTVNPTIYCSCVKQFWDTVKAKTVNGEVQLQALVDKKNVIITESTIRRDLQLEDANGVDCLPNAAIFEQLTLMGVPMENIADKAVYEERDDSLERATTTATGLDSEQDRVLDLENTKTAQAREITSLKKRVKKLERKKKSRTHGLKRLYKVGLFARIDSSDDEAKFHDALYVWMHDLDGDEVFVETEEPVVNAATTTSTIPVSATKDLSDVDMTLAQALAELKSTKPKAVTRLVRS